MSKKLYKSRKNKIIGGVCGGISEYLKVDVTIIRLAWLFLALASDFFGGTFIILYIVAMIIIPMEPDDIERSPAEEEKNKNLPLLIGGGLVIFGIVKIMERIFDVLDIDLRLFGLSLSTFFWPAAFILAGVFIIFVLGRKDK